MLPTSGSARAAVSVVGLVQAGAFVWAARALPIVATGTARTFGLAFAGACAVVALLDAAAAIAAAAGHARAFRVAWRASSWAALAFFGLATWTVLTSAWYVSTLFRGLGPGLAIAMVAVWALVFLVTVPMAAWGLASTQKSDGGGKVGVVAGALMLVAFAGAFGASATEALAARARPRPIDAPDVVVRLERVIRTGGIRAPWARSLRLPSAAECAASPAEARFTLLATHLSRTQQPVATCLQAGSAAELESLFAGLLRGKAYAFPMVVDLVTATQSLDGSLSWLDPFKVRPALDGVCDRGRCLAPWQIVARDRFMGLSLGVDADARLGLDGAALRADLGLQGGALRGLLRIETRSFAVDESLALVPLTRARAPRPEVEPVAIASAVTAARAHLLRSVGADGRLRYRFDPFTGRTADDEAPVTREAGVAFALCELGPTGRPDDDLRSAVSRLLGAIARRERGIASGAALVADSDEITLTSVALPLVALVTCRPLVGDAHDALVAKLLTTLLSLQNERGGFDGALDASGTTHAPAKVLYGEGQAILALVSVEQALAGGLRLGSTEPAAVRQAADRAMTYVSDGYWPAPLRAFFFVEENWHCLAARAALGVHRHDGYERFCLDYAAFKARFVLDAGEELAGGYEWGRLSLPHAAATGGFGETLAAAVDVKRARGDAVAADLVLLRRVVDHLVRAEWTRADCFACADPEATVGAFSRHLGSPVVRVDYVQHAWAALAHGARVLAADGV